MENYLKELWDFLETRDKQRLINRSGSTKKDKNERIRSGQSYLYNRRGMESEVIEVRFNDNVWGSHLNCALDKVIKRYPFYGCLQKIPRYARDFSGPPYAGRSQKCIPITTNP